MCFCHKISPVTPGEFFSLKLNISKIINVTAGFIPSSLALIFPVHYIYHNYFCHVRL